MLFLALFFSVSCTKNIKPKKKVDHAFAQGEDDTLFRPSDLRPPVSSLSEKNRKGVNSETAGHNLYGVDVFKTGEWTIDSLLKIRTTASKGEKIKISFSQQDNVEIDPSISFMKEYEILDYKVVEKKTEYQRHLARLLGKLKKFKGFPNTDYYILSQPVANYLILYKLGAAETIPYTEVPIAVQVKDMLAVPLVGYLIRYCRTEAILDDNDDKTGQYRAVCKGIQPKEAEYIELDENRKQVFQYLPKPDFFPRDFFEGKWFYRRTIVQSPGQKEVGHNIFHPAHLVEFHKTPEKLDVVDASGYNLKKNDRVRALFIPVEWQDYEIARDSERIINESFSERLKKETHDVSKPWVKIKFNDLVQNEVEFSGKKSIKGRVISSNYFSFDVEVTGEGQGAYLIKYAFLKVDKDQTYIEKQWFEDDSSLFFPMFSERRRYHRKAIDHTQEDNDRFFRATRFDPHSEEIKWYFSTETLKNKWVRDIGRMAVALLDKAFKEAGKGSKHKIRVTLDESEDKTVGDFRYNILNLIVSDGSLNGLFGLGPNVANPITGEAISATANVWVSNILSQYIEFVRGYIRYHVYPPAWTFEPSFQGLSLFLHEKIQKLCQEVTEFIQNNKGKRFHPENSSLKDKKEISSCAEKLSFVKILETTLHEMLHGVGMRHIFSASADRNNYYKTYKEIRDIFGSFFPMDEKTVSYPYPPQFSSQMDYVNLLFPVLPVPGKLDIGALRFIYFDKVELVKGGFLNVPAGADKDPQNPQKSILATAKAKGLTKKDIKAYKVCGGKKWNESIDSEFNPDDPLCAYFDYGKTPLEVVQHAISAATSFLLTGRNRYDSETAIHELFRIGSNAAAHIESLYKKWAFDYKDVLLKSKGKTVEDYSFLDENDATVYKNLLEEEAEKNPDFKEYYLIRKSIFDYITKLAFIPVKHCIYKNKEGTYKALALENIEEKIIKDYPENSRVEFMDCKSPPAMKWAKENIEGHLIAEVGFFGKNRKYFIRPKADDPIDEYSPFTTSPLAAEFVPQIEDQVTFSFWSIVVIGSTKQIMQAPDFANRYYKEMTDYMLKGIDLNPYIDGVLDLEPGSIPRDAEGKPALPRFLSYKIDTQTSGAGGKGGLYEGRQINIDYLSQTLRPLITSEKIRYQFNTTFSFYTPPFLEVSRYTKEEEESPGVFQEIFPFISDVYKEYNEIKKEMTFIDFIKNHPAVVLSSEKNLVLIPFAADENNLVGKLSRRHNEYVKCIEEDSEETLCEDIEEKKAFTKAFLNSYFK